MPELTEVAVVVTAPSAFNLDAVTLSIISTSSTVAPEMNISSLSVVTSYKLPNDLPVCLGTNTTVLISGANDDIINVASSVKLNLSPKSQYSKLKKLLIALIILNLTSLSLVTTSGFLTTLNVACKSVSAFSPNSTLYFTG